MRLPMTATLITLSMLAMSGCGESETASETTYGTLVEQAEASSPALFNAGEATYDQDASPSLQVADTGPHADQPIMKASDRSGGIADTTDATEGRKIIYNAYINLVVDQFDGLPGKVQALAKTHGGFVASSNLYGNDGQPRRGEWTLRIPSKAYDKFLAGAQTIGQVRSLNSDSREVTAEYVDLQARLSNLDAQEKRLHDHLNQNTKSLKDILAVEKEIARVRGESERLQGRLNVLKDLTALSTVSLTVDEIKAYTAEATEDPGYATQAARVWGDSVAGVGGFFKGLSLWLVGATPWLVIILPAAAISLMIARRATRRVRQSFNKSAVSKHLTAEA